VFIKPTFVKTSNLADQVHDGATCFSCHELKSSDAKASKCHLKFS